MSLSDSWTKGEEEEKRIYQPMQILTQHHNSKLLAKNQTEWQPLIGFAVRYILVVEKQHTSDVFSPFHYVVWTNHMCSDFEVYYKF